ncbi:hypothetical protein NLG97_g2838 [Lecanicillium saksenae]|uniref:Uncharacterized protein n=1 Tax=Lecanicillium saksenae TaxID=468837 RepID=A0ACC1R3U9_9HYPO|nr:hypothetical protein NLG97_g2838 [Lecanicillium saksenae]
MTQRLAVKKHTADNLLQKLVKIDGEESIDDLLLPVAELEGWECDIHHAKDGPADEQAIEVDVENLVADDNGNDLG